MELRWRGERRWAGRWLRRHKAEAYTLDMQPAGSFSLLIGEKPQRAEWDGRRRGETCAGSTLHVSVFLNNVRNIIC